MLVIDEIFLDQFGVEYLHEVSQHEVGIYDRRLIVVVAASSIGAGVVVIDLSTTETAGVDELRACGFQFIKRVRHPHMQPHIGLRGQQIRLFEVDGRGSVSCVLLVDVIASGIFD